MNKFKRRRLYVLVVAVLGISLVLGYVNRGALRNAWDVVSGADFNGTGHGSITLVINEGDDGAVIAKKLVDLKVVKSYRSVYKLLISRNQVFYPGTYQLKLEMSSGAALEAIANPNNRVSNKVTIKEGWRITKVLSELATQTGIPIDEFRSAAQNLGSLGIPSSEVSAEGWFFPATYDFDPGLSANSVLKQMVARMKQELQRFGVSEQQIAQGVVDERWQALMQFQIDRARALMLSGAPLARSVRGRLGWELRFIVLGGLLSDNFSDERNQVPGLGNAPFLGGLFRNENRSRNKTNLMVFLRPVVLRNAEDTQSLSSTRYQEMIGLQQQAQPKPNPLLDSVNGAPVLGPLDNTPTPKRP